ncbi:methyltransferase [Kineosporia babensis]|uniref:Methyltransferase n=1 Tax=Kineosporia babensis TaxID=499548 RepID=A0A9X1NH40_9ACTN|nr:methyltransferase [Kineosporia babensis]MCD5313925.1 methyltransferase [Kineosporia babensis]
MSTTDQTGAEMVHPWFRQVTQDGENWQIHLDPAVLAARPAPGELVADHLGHWTEVYDWTYQEVGGAPPAETVGWRASDTGEPLPAEVMSEWADRTAELVLSTGATRVLEIGCGSGMLLRRLAPVVKGYLGLDVAADVVERHRAAGLPGVEVLQASAHETGLPQVRAAVKALQPDCVLINSVSQCFPDVSYLSGVVHDALDLLPVGGTLVLGDIRHSGLHEDWAAWSGNPAEADEELLYDPATLAAVAAAASRPVTLSFFAKTLSADNELTRYRYDVVFRVGDSPSPDVPQRSWEELGRPDPATLAQLTGPVRVVGIPHRPLSAEPDAIRGLDLRQALNGRDAAVGLDPWSPRHLSLALPVAAAALPPSALAAQGQAHEPLAAFARVRALETARRELRRAGHGRPAGITVHVPSGAGHSAAATRAAVQAADLAGRTALGGDGIPVTHEALSRIPTAIDQLDAIARQAMQRVLAQGRPKVAPRHEWILRRWESVLAGPQARDRAMLEPEGPLLDRACAALGYPAGMATFYRTALQHLPELLSDEIPAQAMLFPDGDMARSLDKDRRNLSNGYLHGATGSVLAQAAATRGGPLRVLELGGGAGGGTEAALDGLEGHSVDYCFSDISRFFTQAAQERWGERIRTTLLDVDRDLVQQGAVAGGSDVVLAANVLHCAQDIGASLRYIQPLLAPGGLLVVAEATREHLMVLATMQFLLSPRDDTPPPGESDARAGGSVFLSPDGCRHALAEAGFRSLSTVPEPGTPLSAVGQQLVVACRL